MTGTRSRTLEGPGALLEAVALLLDSELDIVVIRRLLRPRVARRIARRLEDGYELLAAAVPQLREVDAFVADWWQRNGYSDYRLASPQALAGLPKHGGVTVHCDEDEFIPGLEPPHLIFGPVSISIGASRTGAIVGAERTEADWFVEDRRYDGTGLTELLASDQHPVRSGRDVRTHVSQGLGDAVLFAGHPVPAWHVVKAGPKRRALFFEYCLLHVNAVPPSGEAPAAADVRN